MVPPGVSRPAADALPCPLVCLSWSAGKPGSQVHSINTYRLRPACTPAETQLKAYQSLARSKLLPNSTAPQDIGIRDVVYKVRGGDVQHM